MRESAHNIRPRPMNQILHLPDLKREVVKLIPVAEASPQLTFRLGYAAPEQEHTPGRPFSSVE